jgi:hypothetical protein
LEPPTCCTQEDSYLARADLQLNSDPTSKSAATAFAIFESQKLALAYVKLGSASLSELFSLLAFEIYYDVKS